jgi:hypothetical protein
MDLEVEGEVVEVKTAQNARNALNVFSAVMVQEAVEEVGVEEEAVEVAPAVQNARNVVHVGVPPFQFRIMVVLVGARVVEGVVNNLR